MPCLSALTDNGFLELFHNGQHLGLDCFNFRLRRYLQLCGGICRSFFTFSVDAQKLANLLRTGMLRPVYHGENGLRTLRELGRSYQTISKDLTRVMNRLKALYRGWGISCAGTQVYAARAREEWLSKIPQAGVRRRAELLYQQLDGLQALRREVRPEFLAESRKHKAAKLLRQIPYIGPVRAARLIALMQTPHRFRSKRQLWTYSGLALRRDDSAQYCFVRGQCVLQKP